MLVAASGGHDVEAAGSLPVEVLGDRICAAASRLSSATYRWLVMIAEFDERGGWAGVGIKSCAHWLAWRCSIAPGTAREHVRVARALTALPQVSDEMSAGRLSYAKVREITRVADRVDETYLVELARTATASQLSRSVRAFRRAAGTRGEQEMARDATWFTAEDGSVVIHARLPAEEGAAVIAALEAARDALRASGGSAETPVVPADALVQLARGYLSATPEDRSGEDRTTVVVHVNAEYLDAEYEGAANSKAAKRSRGNVSDPAAAAAPPALGTQPAMDAKPAIPTDTCHIAGVGGIEPGTARRLACDAVLIGIVRGTGGVVLSHGRRRRLVSEAQRRALQIRDGQCRFPSCQRTSHLEAHHIVPWSHGGPTDMDNLILLCRFHHVACHEGDVRILAGPSGNSWSFVTAQGFPMAGSPTPPDATIAPWRSDSWILHHGLSAGQGWNDPDAENLLPLWAGERFDLADTVSALFASRRRTRQPAARKEAA